MNHAVFVDGCPCYKNKYSIKKIKRLCRDTSKDFENKKSTVRDGEQITLAPLSVILLENDI